MRLSGWTKSILFFAGCLYLGGVLGDQILRMKEHSYSRKIKKAEEFRNGIELPFAAPVEKTEPLITRSE